MNLNQLKDEIEKLPLAEREACDELYSHLKWQVRVAGNRVGPLALMLAAEEVKADFVNIKSSDYDCRATICKKGCLYPQTCPHE